MGDAAEFTEITCPKCRSKRAILPDDPPPFACYSCGAMLGVSGDRRVVVRENVIAIGAALQIYQDRDLQSGVIAVVPKGVVLELGTKTIVEGAEWLEAAYRNQSGYVLALHARTQTTFEFVSVPARPNKAYVCPTCHQLVASPLRNGQKQFYCLAGHRAYATAAPGGVLSYVVGTCVGACLLAALGYLATYYVPQVFHNLLNRFLWADRAFPDFAEWAVRMAAWLMVILRVVLVGAALNLVREGLLFARYKQPMRGLGLERIGQSLAGLAGCVIAGFLLLPAVQGPPPGLAVALYQIALNFHGTQLWI